MENPTNIKQENINRIKSYFVVINDLVEEGYTKKALNLWNSHLRHFCIPTKFDTMWQLALKYGLTNCGCGLDKKVPDLKELSKCMLKELKIIK